MCALSPSPARARTCARISSPPPLAPFRMPRGPRLKTHSAACEPLSLACRYGDIAGLEEHQGGASTRKPGAQGPDSLFASRHPGCLFFFGFFAQVSGTGQVSRTGPVRLWVFLFSPRRKRRFWKAFSTTNALSTTTLCPPTLLTTSFCLPTQPTRASHAPNTRRSLCGADARRGQELRESHPRTGGSPQPPRRGRRRLRRALTHVKALSFSPFSPLAVCLTLRNFWQRNLSRRLTCWAWMPRPPLTPRPPLGQGPQVPPSRPTLMALFWPTLVGLRCRRQLVV